MYYYHKYNLIFWVVFIILLSLLGFIHQAQAEKIAYVDTKRLIDEAPQGRNEVKNLEDKFGKRNRELRARFELFRSQKVDLEKNAMLMSNEEVEKKTRELRELQRDLERAQREYNEDYADSRNAGISRLENLISMVIIELAERNEIDLVLQQVVYASGRIDLTDKVLEELQSLYQQ